jgi:mono/diheme cytochrome c family protein
VDIYREMHYQVSQRRLEPDRLAAPPGAVPITGGRVQYTFEEATGLQNPVRRTPDAMSQGRTTYAVNCAMCHGPNGRAQTFIAQRFAQSNALPPVDLSAQRARSRTDGQLYWLVTNGIGNMPPFGDLLTENERWAVVHMIRDFQGQ